MEEGKFEHPFIDNLVGIPHGDSEVKNATGKSVEEYMRHTGSNKHEGVEIEKTPEDIEIIQFAIDSVNEVMKEYGREKDIELSMNHIHIVPVGGTEIVTQGNSKKAAQASTRSSLIIDRDPSNIQFCLRAFHEILHLKSYVALQILPPPEENSQSSLKAYRKGFMVVSRDGKERYFTDLEEGVIGMLTEKFFNEKIKSEILFSEELKNKGEVPFEFSRQEEIQLLNDLVDQIFEKNIDDFKSRDEILELFIRAQVNGNLLRVGKLIEKTFGKGSFREISEGNYPKDTHHDR
ncbi:hypothetical protein H0W91_01255 [Patescibacteria group bacterium]|nr:hypothetical protein [Patescibacteria group bacterium]